MKQGSNRHLARASALAAMLAALPVLSAAAQGVDLRGVWQYSRVNTRNENYSGHITIETGNQASDVTKRFSGPDVAQTGYISVNGSEVDIVFTKAIPSGPPTYNPDHFHCTIQSDRAMSCGNVDSKGTSSYRFALVRVGEPRRK